MGSFTSFKLTHFPHEIASKGIIAQENKPLEWVNLYFRGHKILTAYLILTQLINQGKLNVNKYTDLILNILYYL